MVNVFNALSLICKWAGKIEACPTITLTFVNRAWWTATALVAWNKYRYWSARRADEHIGLDSIHVSEVIGSVDAPLGRLKSLSDAIGLNAATSILDGDGALSHDVVYIPRMVMPRTGSLAYRCFEGPGRQLGWAVP